MSWNKKLSITICLSMLISIFICMMSSSSVLAKAGGAAGSESTGGSGGCSGTPGYMWQDVCTGAVFKKYDVDSYPASRYSDDNAKLSNINSVCKSVNADQFYVLGLLRHKKASNGKDPVPGSFSGEIARFIQVNQLKPEFEGGTKRTPYLSAYGENFASVKNNFDKAQNYARNLGEMFTDAAGYPLSSTSWSNVSWFCWNDEWDNVGEVSAYSWVQVNGYTAEEHTDTPDGHVEVTAGNIAEDTATVKFKHQLMYASPFDSGSDTYEWDFMDWYTEIKQNGASLEKTPGPTKPVFEKSAERAPSGKLIYWSRGYLGEKEVTVTLPDIGTIKVCSYIYYKPKSIYWKYDDSLKYFVIDESTTSSRTPTNYPYYSFACATLSKEPATPPPSGADQMHFWSTSGVEANGTDVDSSKAKGTSLEKDPSAPDDHNKFGEDVVTVQLSTDEDTIDVKFTHTLYFRHEDKDGKLTSDTTGVYSSDICTKYTFETETEGGSASITDPSEGTKCVAERGENSVEITSNTYRVNAPEPGTDDPLHICQKVMLDPKHLKLKKEEKTKADGTKYNYYSKDSSAGDLTWSMACIDIYRPNLPNHTDGPTSTGATETGPMYAGEYTDMRWWFQAKAYKTRRIMQYKSIVYEVKVDETHDADKTQGNFKEVGEANANKSHKGTDVHSDLEPCDYWTSSEKFTKNRGCEKVDRPSEDFTAEEGRPLASEAKHTLEMENRQVEESMVVPDYTGDKYCNSLGIQWAYWYFVGHSRTGEASWEKGKDYWTHYSSACRSIAKKPSVSIWNNGLFIGSGKLSTIVASRYDATDVGTVKPRNYDYHYGSWSEYIASVNGEVSGFSSGAFLSNGSRLERDIFDLLKNSPMTISNFTNDVGKSRIAADSFTAYYQRLGNYLWKDTDTNKIVSSVSELANELRNASRSEKKTFILATGGNLPITEDIIREDKGFDTIQTLPQAIIYAEGNINIAQNVKRIDAWLIAGGVNDNGAQGTIDTCKKDRETLIYKETEAKVNDWNHGQTCYEQLIINGPVIAKNIDLKRTYGAERWGKSASNYDPAVEKTGGSTESDSRSATAEVFNLSADVYLWAYAQAARYSSSYNEAYIRELPPRY